MENQEAFVPGQTAAEDVGDVPEASVADAADAEAPAENAVEEPADATADLKEELARMEQRYRSLAGVLRSKDEQLRQLQELIEKLSKEQREARKEPERPLVTDTDRSVVGDEIADFVQRVVNAAVSQAVSRIETRLSELESALNTTQQISGASAQQVFMQRLSELVPDWSKLNTDPQFIAWLEASPTRNAQFQQAAAAFDADAVAVYFNAFKAETGVGAQRAVKKRKQVQQARPASSTPEARAAGGKKVWTREEIIEFYATGKQRYSPEEYKRIERDIFEAQAEGRIQV